MSKFLNIGLAAVFALTAALPMASVAQDDEDSEVTTNWKNMGRELGRGMANVGRMDADQMVEVFTMIRPNILANMEILPERMGDATEAEWKADVSYSLGMFDAALAAAEEGETDAAVAIMAAFDDYRGDMHDKYGI